MKQFQFIYQNPNQFQKEMVKIKQWRKSRVLFGTIFQIFSESLDKELLSEVCQVIEQEMPSAIYMGCSSNGNILEGQVETEIVIICTIMEYPSTHMEVVQMPLTAETDISTVQALSAMIDERACL